MEYGSIWMVRGENGSPIMRTKTDILTSRVFSLATRLLALLESFARVLDWQVLMLGGGGEYISFFLYFFLQPG